MSALQDALDKINNLKNKVQELVGMNDETSNTITQHVDSIRSRIEELGRRTKKFKTIKEQLSSKMVDLQDKVESLEQEATEFRQSMDPEVLEKIENSTRNMDKLTSSIDTLKQSINGIQKTDIGSFDSELGQLDAVVGDLEGFVGPIGEKQPILSKPMEQSDYDKVDDDAEEFGLPFELGGPTGTEKPDETETLPQQTVKPEKITPQKIQFDSDSGSSSSGSSSSGSSSSGSSSSGSSSSGSSSSGSSSSGSSSTGSESEKSAVETVKPMVRNKPTKLEKSTANKPKITMGSDVDSDEEGSSSEEEILSMSGGKSNKKHKFKKHNKKKHKNKTKRRLRFKIKNSSRKHKK
jgi:archaellum component FlaC